MQDKLTSPCIMCGSAENLILQKNIHVFCQKCRIEYVVYPGFYKKKSDRIKSAIKIWNESR